MAPFSLSGKTAIVTGAGSGINLAFAELLLSKGCNVVLADLSLRPEAQKVIHDHREGNRAIFVKTDVASWPQLKNIFETALANYGDFDIVCPGAGVYEPEWSGFWHPPGSVQSKDALGSGHYRMLDINLTHPIRTTQLAISYWLYPCPINAEASNPQTSTTTSSPKTPKRIIHISSVAGSFPNPNAPLYGASKFAITGFVRCMANLEGLHSIRVNAVAPGLILTPLWTEHPGKLKYVDEEKDGWATPHEVAEAMVRCLVDEKLGGGSILEVGAKCTRVVEMYRDPGPDPDSKKGLLVSNGIEGAKETETLLNRADIWGCR